MALKLKSRDLPQVKFRRVLPAFLGPDGEECFIEIDAKAGGAVNAAYLAKAEALAIRARVMDRGAGKIDDDEKHVKTQYANVLAVLRDGFAAIYDTCVIEWRSNIIDGDTPIICNRANFLALTEERVPELAEALSDFKAAVLGAADAQAADDEETVKN